MSETPVQKFNNSSNNLNDVIWELSDIDLILQVALNQEKQNV